MEGSTHMIWTFEELLIELCSPTIVGCKPASLFRYKPQEGVDVHQEVKEWNDKLSPSGISVMILKECCHKKTYLIYVYRSQPLSLILSDHKVNEFLEKNGYSFHASVSEKLSTLSDHLCLDKDFPHEIGVFLGYPLEDVIGFIENRGENYMYCGHWKVYSNLKKAIKKFNTYNKCTLYCKERFAQGDSVARLAVAV